MSSSKTGAWFDSTSWTLILGASDDPTRLERILQAYWSPVYAFIRRKGYGPHDASDLTQEFLLHVVLGRGLLARADATRGRFRTFLKASLRNFLIDQYRRSKRPANVDGDPLFGLIEDDRGARDPEDACDAAFDRQWAAATLAMTVERLEAACRADGLTDHWIAFQRSVLAPAVRGAAPVSLDDLVDALNAESPAQVSNMIQTVKRRFRTTLREVVRETVTDGADIEAELAELKRYAFGT